MWSAWMSPSRVPRTGSAAYAPLFRTRLPYTLGFDVRVTRVHRRRSWWPRPPGSWGTGRWTLTPVLAAPGPLQLGHPHHQAVDEPARAGRPQVFRWNHES